MEVVYKINGRAVSREEFSRPSDARRFNEMVLTATPPGAMTDREFMEGHANGNQFEATPELGDYYRSVAESHGQSVKGKVYKPGLARFPGDPMAWVAGRGDAERVIDANGWGASGAVNRKISNVAQPLKVPLAQDLIEEEIIDRMQAAVDQGGRPQDVDVEAAAEEIVSARAHGHKAAEFKD